MGFSSHCERDAQNGQIEIGVIEHDGREFRAIGASVQGREVTGYTKCQRGNVSLQTWCGKTMIGSRSTIVRDYRQLDSGLDPVAIVFPLTRGRFIVGYALDVQGALFRGQLIEHVSAECAAREAEGIAEYWLQRDAEDDELMADEPMEAGDDDE